MFCIEDERLSSLFQLKKLYFLDGNPFDGEKGGAKFHRPWQDASAAAENRKFHFS